MRDLFSPLEDLVNQGMSNMLGMRGSHQHSFHYVNFEKDLSLQKQEYEKYIRLNFDQDLLTKTAESTIKKGCDMFSKTYLEELKSNYMEDRYYPDRYFFDMDGVLYVFNNTIASLDVLYEEFYFKNLPQQRMVAHCFQKTLEEHPHQTYILSHCLDSPYAKKEKMERLKLDFPALLQQNIIMVPYGEAKTSYIPLEIKENDHLVDDYNKNLICWKEHGGHAVKLINNINDRHLSWQGDRLYYDDPKIVQSFHQIVESPSRVKIQQNDYQQDHFLEMGYMK